MKNRLLTGIAHAFGMHKNDNPPGQVNCWCQRAYPNGEFKRRTLLDRKEPKPFL